MNIPDIFQEAYRKEILRRAAAVQALPQVSIPKTVKVPPIPPEKDDEVLSYDLSLVHDVEA